MIKKFKYFFFLSLIVRIDLQADRSVPYRKSQKECDFLIAYLHDLVIRPLMDANGDAGSEPPNVVLPTSTYFLLII